MTVLLAEQDALLRDSLRSLLCRAGFKAVDVLASTKAWPLPEAGGAPAVLVADAGDGSGSRVCGLVREAKRRWPQLRVVLISGCAVDPAEMALADRFLSKPFRGKALVQAVREVAGQVEDPGPPPAWAPQPQPAQALTA